MVRVARDGSYRLSGSHRTVALSERYFRHTVSFYGVLGGIAG
jgi:hypothetical protein